MSGTSLSGGVPRSSVDLVISVTSAMPLLFALQTIQHRAMPRLGPLQNASGVPEESHALLGGYHSLILESSTLLPESL